VYRPTVISRRGVLGLAVITATGLAGCSNSSPGDKGASGGGNKSEDPDTAVLAEAVADTRDLIARYDDAPASIRKKIIALRADHQAHLEALGATGAATPTPSSSTGATAKPSPGPAALADLAVAEKTAADRRVDQCKRAKSTDLARLLASIGGCEAAHAKALDDLAGGA
jgi:hypothetical protein